MKVLVIYYSRSGVTKKAAERIADGLKGKAEVTVEKIIDSKDHQGVLGWVAAVKDAMMKNVTPIELVKGDPAAFDLVAIGTPVWAWTVASPVRTFCSRHGKAAGKVAFFCTMGNSGETGALQAMKDLCGKEPVATLAIAERHVRKDDPEKFIATAAAFADAIIAVGSA